MLLAERANFHSKGSDSSVRFCLPSNLRRALVGIIRITRMQCSLNVILSAGTGMLVESVLEPSRLFHPRIQGCDAVNSPTIRFHSRLIPLLHSTFSPN